MTLNPILALEVRARWRSNRSFLLLFVVACALASVGLIAYADAVSSGGLSGYIVSAPNGNADNARANAIGRALFMVLAHANIIAWLFIAAASAAPAIARERERGLLESLQLSHVSAASQIVARLAANLALLSALQLVLAPVYAVAFLMGGVSPAEVGAAFYLVACSAILGSCVGLWFSARAHRPNGALFSALGALALFSAAIYFYFGRGITGSVANICLFHPSAFFFALTIPNFDWTMHWGGSPALCLATVSAGWLAFCAVTLWSATRNVGHILAPALWGQNSTLVDKLRARQSAPSATAPPSPAKRRASGALLADLSFERFTNFSNPMLAREVRARFRLRRVGLALSLVRGALFVGACAVWIGEVYWLFETGSRAAMVPYTALGLLLVGMACLSVVAATSWTREREGGTWESLRLSLLTSSEILRAKWLSPLVSFSYYSAPLWILLPFGALFFGAARSLWCALIVVAWWGATVAFGLFFSSRVRNGTAAIALTLGLLAVFLAGRNIADDVVEGALNVVSSVGVVYNIGGLVALGEPDENEVNLYPIYQKETGRAAPTNSVEMDGFMQWQEQYYVRKMREREWKEDAAMWHPLAAFARLSGKYGGFGDFNPYYYGDRVDLAPHIGPFAIVSLLFPGALTWILLIFAGRALRREMLRRPDFIPRKSVPEPEV